MAEHDELRSTRNPSARKRPIGFISGLTRIPPPSLKTSEQMAGQKLGRTAAYLTAFGFNCGAFYLMVFRTTISRPWLRRTLGIPVSLLVGGIVVHSDGDVLFEIVNKHFTRPSPRATLEQK